MRLAAIAVLLAVPGSAVAQSRPTLDDFYDRTRSRDDGFDSCIGYCTEHYLAGFLIGAQTANPSTDVTQPQFATGARLGIDLAVRGSYANIARTKLWGDVLRVNSSGDWITDVGWQTTSFAALREPGQAGLHLSLDTLLAKHTELEPSDFAQLQRAPYRVFDIEAEVAPTANKVDKDAFWVLPIGIANRLRWSDTTMQLDRRTSVSGAVAFRGFPNGIRHHYQMDVLRVKHTSWDVDGGEASSWTISTGYQRMSPGIEELQIWLPLKIWKLTFKIPNTDGRRKAVKIHDLHHVLTGYRTDFRGESEIAAWELASGCLRMPAAFVLNSGALAVGVLIAPIRCARAWARGRQTRNLYREDGVEHLLSRDVAEVQATLGLTGEPPRVRLRDLVGMKLAALPPFAVLTALVAAPLVGLAFLVRALV